VRRCLVCGSDLADRRSDCRYCSPACRQEAYRVRRLAAGKPVGNYETLLDRMAALGRPRRRTRNTSAEEVS
jgi:hypothetical protein